MPAAGYYYEYESDKTWWYCFKHFNARKWAAEAEYIKQDWVQNLLPKKKTRPIQESLL